MTTACTMKLEEATRDRTGPLEVTLLASADYCVDPNRNTDHSAYVGIARITNIGPQPLTLTYSAGGTDFRAFRSDRVSEIRNGRLDKGSAYMLPPLAPGDVEVRTVQLAPNQSIELKSWSRHHNTLDELMIYGERPNSTPVPLSERHLRNFVVDYVLNVTIDGHKPLSRTYQIPVRAILPEG